MQMDVKIEGVAIEILEETFIQAKHARETILDDMLKALPAPRETLSPHAPRILKVVINVDKIGDVIGPGGESGRKNTTTDAGVFCWRSLRRQSNTHLSVRSNG